MEFKRLEYCGVHVTTGTVSGVPTTTPTNEGSEHLVLDANGNILEYYIWTKDGTGTSKWVGGKYKQTDPIDVNNNAINYVPTSTGNANNRNSIVTDPAGDKWIIDANGDATKVTTTFTAFKELNQWHVDKNGNDTTGSGADERPFLTITKALQTATQADVVIVNEGTYAEAVAISTQNLTLRGQGAEYGGLTEFNSLSVTANGTSVRVSSLTSLGVITHSGTSSLYLSDMTVTGNYTSSTTAYSEIKHSRLQDGTISKTAAGVLFITDSLIGNATFSTANSAIVLRNVTIDAGKTVTIGAGVVYSLADVVGNVVINASAVPLETALLAQGLSAELSKAAQTASFNMLRILHPDTNNANVNLVSWNTVTKRLEVSALPAATTVTQANTTGHAIGTVNGITLYEAICSLGTFSYSNGILSITFTDEAGAITTRSITIPNPLWDTAITDPTATGNTGTLPRFVENTVNGSKWYIDGNGVAKVIEQATIGGQNVYFNAENPTAGTIFDTENPPLTNNDALKNNSDNTYYGTDGSVWTWNGTAYVTKVYNFPLHQRDVTTATAGQTSFVLTKVPVGNTEKVHVTRNGVDISRAFTWVGNTGTYTPANNYGCTIDASDLLQFHYEAL